MSMVASRPLNDRIDRILVIINVAFWWRILVYIMVTTVTGT